MSAPARPAAARGGFTMIELLAVTAILGVLACLLLPAAGRVREQGRAADCLNNLRQLAAGNHRYADDAGAFVAAAPDIFDANRRRWHGERTTGSGAFSVEGGPLGPYLGASGRLKRCASFQPEAGFELGCGGYGYNAGGVGSRAYLFGYNAEAVAHGMAPADLQDPAGTVMFADAAFPQRVRGRTILIEYSFAEAFRHLSESGPAAMTGPADPSIHFRHRGRAGAAWADGHVSRETMTLSGGALFRQQGVGWFGGPDNRLFDPF